MTKSTNVFFVCDCSGSMAGPLERQMRTTVRETIEALAANEPGQRFDVTIAPFSGSVRLGMPFTATQLTNRNAAEIDQIDTNRIGMGGGTALLDAVGRCLEEAEKHLHDTPALVMVFTDGFENQSHVWNATRLQAKLTGLDKTGNLTLTVAGPAGVGTMLSRLGLASGNFRSWDGTEQELRAVKAETVKAVNTYATHRSTGGTKSSTFYADASALTPAGIKAMTKEVKPTVSTVTRRMAGRAIADYFGKDFKKGAHFYELIKSEKIQDGKELVIYIKDQNEYRLGSRAVRSLLGLPETGEIRVAPSAHNDKYTIFVQSDSVNRKVVEGQQMLTLPE